MYVVCNYIEDNISVTNRLEECAICRGIGVDCGIYCPIIDLMSIITLLYDFIAFIDHEQM